MYLRSSAVDWFLNLLTQIIIRKIIGKMKIGLLKKILKGSAYVFVLKMIGAVAFFLITVYISKLSGPSVLGKFQLLSKFVLIGSLFATLGLEIFAARRIVEIGENRELTKKFIGNSIRIMLSISFILGIVILSFRDQLEKMFFKTEGMAVYISFSASIIFFYSAYSFLCQIYRGYGSIKAFAFFRYSWLHVFFLILLVFHKLYFGKIEEHWIYILYYIGIAGCFLAIVMFTKVFLRKRKYNDVRSGYENNIKTDVKRSFPMMLSSSLSFFNAYSNIFIIGYFLSTYEVGIFSGIMQFMMIFTFVSVSLSSYVSPFFAKSHLDRDYKQLRSLYLHSIMTGGILLVPVFIILAIFPSLVLDVTFGAQYAAHSYLMTILAVGYFISSLSGPAIDVMNMTNNQSKLVLFSIINVTVGFILTALLTWKFTLIGAAIASSITNVVFRAFLFYYITKFIATEKNNLIDSSLS